MTLSSATTLPASGSRANRAGASERTVRHLGPHLWGPCDQHLEVPSPRAMHGDSVGEPPLRQVFDSRGGHHQHGADAPASSDHKDVGPG